MAYETTGEATTVEVTGGDAQASEGRATGRGTPEKGAGAELTRERVLAVCQSNWEYRGIDDASMREMLEELTAHLDEAAAAGRTPRDVVGPDAKAFAAAWARARTPLPRRVLRMAALIPFVLGSLLLLTHLLDRSMSLAIEAPRITFYVALAAAIVAWEMRRGSLGFRGWIIAGLVALPAAVITALLIGDEPLFHLPLWGTLLFLAPGLPYTVMDIRARNNEPDED
ncbi:hypothetical protein [Streptomyces sp. CC224B]|uniref:hypothetical protein n=1 Tax=Streptomyces sp. CC224B TaxID=3044571 RepID=UPI0024A95E26|nr:hypothetical protein [Streptomyces sp. CC224B]